MQKLTQLVQNHDDICAWTRNFMMMENDNKGLASCFSQSAPRVAPCNKSSRDPTAIAWLLPPK